MAVAACCGSVVARLVHSAFRSRSVSQRWKPLGALGAREARGRICCWAGHAARPPLIARPGPRCTGRHASGFKRHSRAPLTTWEHRPSPLDALRPTHHALARGVQSPAAQQPTVQRERDEWRPVETMCTQERTLCWLDRQLRSTAALASAFHSSAAFPASSEVSAHTVLRCGHTSTVVLAVCCVSHCIVVNARQGEA